MKIIKLTSAFNNSNNSVYVVVEKIEFVAPKKNEQISGGPYNGSLVCLPAHNNGGIHVCESAEDVIEMMVSGPFVGGKGKEWN